MSIGIVRAVCISACVGSLLACGGGMVSDATDAASDATSDATSDASDASRDTAPVGTPYDPSCPKGEAGSPSSWAVGPGDPCTIEHTQCYSYAVVNGTWMQCCSGTWRAFPDDAGSSACPK